MKLIYLDDARQRNKNCTRAIKGDLVAVGGLVCDADSAFDLELRIDQICSASGFPDEEVFKWSPDKGQWLYENLVEERRRDFFLEVLSAVGKAGGRYVVVVADNGYRTATKVEGHELDALTMCLERCDNSMSPEERGIAIVAKPSGGTKDEKHLLDECKKIKSLGTDFSKFSKIGMNIITMPFAHSRMLQVADLVASTTTALVAGNEKYASLVFEAIRPNLLQNAFGNIGGIGLKIHPDFVYENLYHWILGEVEVWAEGYSLPRSDRPFSRNARTK